MNCIIIDDNEQAIKTLTSLLANFCPNVKVLGFSQTIKEGVKLINTFQPDLLFLDVEIKNEMGFDLFSFFTNPTFAVVFTTAHEKYALKAIKNNCSGYLLKPIDPAELVKTINSIKQKEYISIELNKGNPSKRLTFIVNNEYVFIDENEIMYLKADGKYTDIVTVNNKTHKSSKNLGEIESLLPHNFFKCHKACIVNMNFISKFIKDDLQIILTDNSTVYLAYRRKEDFLKLFHRL